MIRCKTKHKLYVAPEIEVTTYDEENLMQASINADGKPQEGSDGSDGNAKVSGQIIIFDDFDEGFEEDFNDDFNYDSYKKQSMLW